MQDNVTELVLYLLKYNTELQVKIAKMIASDLVNLRIDWKDLVGCLRETSRDVHDMMGILSAV